MPNVNDIQTQVRDAVKRGQTAVNSTIKDLSGRLPEVDLGNLPLADQLPKVLPQAKAAVNTAFDVAEQAVTRQRDFVISVLDTVEHRLATTDAKSEPKAKKSSGGESPAKEPAKEKAGAGA